MEHQDVLLGTEEGETLPPFTLEFVLSVSRTRVLKAVKYAIRKTQRRLSDFPEGSEKHQEVIDTLEELHDWYNEISSLLDERISRF